MNSLMAGGVTDGSVVTGAGGSPGTGSVVLWGELLAEAETRLAASGIAGSAAAGEARRIVTAAAGCDEGAWFSVLSAAATQRGVASFDRMLARRIAGEPLQYVLGSWGFRTLDLFVDARVLIPRPETEATVACALHELHRRTADPAQRPGSDAEAPAPASVRGAAPAPDRVLDQGDGGFAAAGGSAGVREFGSAPAPSTSMGRAGESPERRAEGAMLLAADLGCGSGAIGLSLVAERTDVEVICSDVSADALAVAGANLAGLGRPARRVRLAEGSWFDALPEEARGRFDLIVSNPPYIAAGGSLAPEVADHEPPVALYSGATGLEATATILAGAPEWLAPGAAVVLEMADDTAPAVRRLATAAGLVDIAVHPDLAGHDRVLVAHRRP